MAGLVAAVVTAVALAALLASSGGASAGLLDNETFPIHNPQYQDFLTAYNVTPDQYGTPLVVRKDGGSDDDFLRLRGLTVGDMVHVEGNQSEVMAAVNYWVYDPGRFPIWYYNSNGEEGRERFNVSFLVAVEGDYFFNTALGFGDTLITITFTTAPSGRTPDGDDRPEDAVLMVPGDVTTTSLELPYDASDFFKFDVPENASAKYFVRLRFLEVTGGNYQWELYNESGIKRPTLDYHRDALLEDTGDLPFNGKTFDSRGTHYLRLWCTQGKGTVRFQFDLRSYVTDGDDLGNAIEVHGGDVINDSVNTWFDINDYYRIALSQGDRLNLWLYVDDDIDLFLRNDRGDYITRSDKEGNETEHIDYTVVLPGTAWYYITVNPYPLYPDDHEVIMGYTLVVRTNLDPVAQLSAAGVDDPHVILEDEVDTSVDLALLFRDPEGGPLAYSILPGHNESLLTAALVGTRLRLLPAPNASGFEQPVTLEAVDDHGYTCRYTLNVFVLGVDDAPTVTDDPPPVVVMDEDGASAAINFAPYFTDIDDEFWSLSYSVFCPPELRASNNRGVVTFLAAVADWNGETSATVRASDPTGLYAALTVRVSVRPVNDAPRALDATVRLSASGDSVPIDVDAAFLDVDGDELTYGMTGPLAVVLHVEGDAVHVSGLLAFQGTMAIVPIVARDPAGETSPEVRFIIDVAEVPEPPTLLLEAMEVNVTEGSELPIINLTVLDPDPTPRPYTLVVRAEGDELEFHMQVTAHGIEWLDGPAAWTPAVLRRARNVLVNVTVVDWPFSSNASFVAHVARLNRAPVVLRVELDLDRPYVSGEVVTAFANSTDEDGDELEYTWYLDGVELPSDGQTLQIDDATVGVHRIRVVASDGYLSGENTATFGVASAASADDGYGLAGVVAGIALVLALAVVLVLLLRRRRGGRPARAD